MYCQIFNQINMKRIFTIMAAATLCFTASASTVFTFDNDNAFSQTIDGITVTLEKGDGQNDPAFLSNQQRLYAKNTITVAGADLSRIDMTFTKQGTKTYASLSASNGKLVSGGTSTSKDDAVTDVWTGTATSVTFTLGDSGQRVITSLVVNGDGSTNPGGNDNPGSGDESSELNPDYKYSEPTVIGVPNKTVQGEAYSFISNNIEVSCSTGAISTGYFSAHADNTLTFTATQPIKGIEINGLVKKGFTATASAGEISYVSPSSDTEAEPVVVLTDINNKTVTITCNKQLRCYSVKVYFEANPEATINGGGSSSSEVSLTYDAADVVYEIEWSEIFEENNYSIYLYNESDPYYPYFALDIYPLDKDNIAGDYTMSDWSLGEYTYYVYGESDNDMTWITDGTVSITKSGDTYTIKGSVTCDNNVTYSINYSGKPYFYDSNEYYEDDDPEDPEDPSSVDKIDTDQNAVDANTPMYDLNGRRVSKDFRGLYIRNGRKIIRH